jgi:hypothetical protein
LERCDFLGLETLEYRRVKAKLYECYKIVNGLIDVEFSNFFKLRGGHPTCGNQKKLQVPHSGRLNVCKFSFVARVIPRWNLLLDDVASSPSLCVFKYRLANTLPDLLAKDPGKRLFNLQIPFQRQNLD